MSGAPYMPNEALAFPNGIDAATGGYALLPQPLEKLAGLIRELPGQREEFPVIDAILQNQRRTGSYAFALPSDLDTRDLAQTGWGVIFPSSGDPSLVQILQPLFDLRRSQAGDLFRLIQPGYNPGENAADFLKRNGVGPGPIDPRRMPYYLLLVGGPEQIPFAFQSQLSRLGYAVGRLAFSDPFEYAQYANSLIQMERGEYLMPRTAAFFDAAPENDPGVKLPGEQLVAPLVSDFDKQFGPQGWKVQDITGEFAVKSNLAGLLGGGRTPAFLFVNAEGLQVSSGVTEQRAIQGALLCNDWPGLGSTYIPQPEHYFAGYDLLPDARVFGLVAFLYASFSMGTPPQDEMQRLVTGQSVSGQPSTAALAQRLLAHPSGSALAVVGLTGRAWGYSFQHPRLAGQTDIYRRVLGSLAAGEPLGSALSWASIYAAQVSAEFQERLGDFKSGSADPADLLSLWVSCQDFLALSLLGDPAVQLRLAGGGRVEGTIDGSVMSNMFAGVEPPGEAPAKAAPPEARQQAPKRGAGPLDEGPAEEEPEEEEEVLRPAVELSEEERQRVQRILAIVQPLSNDQPADKDLLGITDEVHALADALILRQIRPPLAVGILGGWGSGKSSVMRLIHKRIAGRRAERVDRGWAADPGAEPLSAFVGHAYQIAFNAWTYAKSNLWASLMQTIFFELNRQMAKERELADERVRNERPELFDPPGSGALKRAEKGAWAAQLRDALRRGGSDFADIYELHPTSGVNPLWEGLRQRKQEEVEALQKTESAIAEIKARRDELSLKRQQAALQRLERQAQAQALNLLVGTAQAVVKDSGASRDVKGALKNLELEKQRLELQDAPEPPSGKAPSPEGGEPPPAEAPSGTGAAGAGQAGTSPAEDKQAEQGGASLEAQTLELVSALHGFSMTLVRMGYLFGNTGIWGKLVIVALAVLGLTAILLPILRPETLLFKDTLARLAALLPMLLPWARMAANWSGQVNQMLTDYETKVESGRQNLMGRLGEELARRGSLDTQDMQTALLRAGVDAGRQEQELERLAADGNLAALDEQLHRAQLKAEEQRRLAGPAGQYVSLLEFVRSRLDEEIYEKELGLMHRIKRDIDELTDGLTVRDTDIDAIRQAKRELFPRGEARILLYIDDLDRCPPPRVVEVLEAVQLLVSTELFIVVLGLDTRYVTRALEKEYKEILQHSGDPSGLDYIEKIIQLPYRVRPISPQRLDAYIDELARSEIETPPVGMPPGAGEGPQGTPGQTPVQTPAGGEAPPGPTGTVEQPGGTPVEPAGAAEPSQAPPGAPGGTQAGAIPQQNIPSTAAPGAASPSAGASAAAGPPSGDGPRPLRMEMIRLVDDDKLELERCLKQISLTPRSVKRLVNVFKLLKVFWVNTQGADPPLEIKRTVIGLLSLSAAYPEAMVEAFAQLDVRYRTNQRLRVTVGSFLKSMERTFLADEQHEAISWQLDNFRKDVTALMLLKEEPFFKISLRRFGDRSFNLVRSFSFVGDPVFAFEDRSPDGAGSNPSAGQSGTKETPAADRTARSA